jgi:hypothetical protein
MHGATIKIIKNYRFTLFLKDSKIDCVFVVYWICIVGSHPVDCFSYIATKMCM